MSGPRDNRRSLGKLGEDLASRYLKQRGYQILTRNLRSPLGEIDIVAYDGDCLALVEVRARRGHSHGTPEESITPAKQKKLRRLAEEYVQSLDIPPHNYRVDVVAVEFSPAGELLRLDLIRDALA